MAKMIKSHCVDPHKRIDSVQDFVVNVVGGEYTAGDALDVTANEFNVLVDGVTIVINGSNQLEATGSASVTILAGAGIEVTGGDTINVDLGATNPCLEFDGSSDLQLQINADGGLERTATGVRDKWRRFTYTGQTVGAVANTDETCLVDNVLRYNGETITSMTSDQIRVYLNPRLVCADNTTINFIYMPAILGSPATDYMAVDNFLYELRGASGYSGASTQYFTHNSSGVMTWAAAPSGGSGGHNGVWGRLASDLTTTMNSVTINVEGYVGSDPGASISAANPEDTLNFVSGRYLYAGNVGGIAHAIEYSGGWMLVVVQSPVQRPA